MLKMFIMPLHFLLLTKLNLGEQNETRKGYGS